MNNIKIIDNSNDIYQLKSFLEKQLISNQFSQFSIATGYWDLPVMVELLSSLEIFISNNQNAEIRLLIGEEPSVKTSQLDTAFPEKYLNKDLNELPFKSEYQKAVDFINKNIENKKFNVKLFKNGFLHAKCYIIGNQNERAIGIIGSSNFTKNGILNNKELNAVEDDHRIVNFLPQTINQEPSHRSWFEKLWNSEDAVDWNFQFKMEILGLSKFGNQTYSPYEMYIRLLYEIYENDIKIEQKAKNDDRFESRLSLALFQAESVGKVIDRLENKYLKMSLLADSVGLGKSFVANSVLETYGYFKRQNVMVICPASLRNDWTNHLADITLNAPVFSITQFAQDKGFKDIKEELLKRKEQSKRKNAIELIVIDESHNLKTQGAKSFQNLLNLLVDRRFCEEEPKILMLSATPVNNGIKDLANQILLAKRGNTKAFSYYGIPDFTQLFYSTQREFIKSGSNEVFTELFPILNKILVKRTRHQVKKDFPDSEINGKKIIFPEEHLENIIYKLDSKEIRNTINKVLKNLEKNNTELFDFFTTEDENNEEEEIELQGIISFFNIEKNQNRVKLKSTEYESIFHFIDKAIKGLKLIPYSYLTYKLNKTEEEEKQAKSRNNLTGIFKITLFKSFDSSVFTFQKRIERYENYLKDFENLLINEKKVVKKEIIDKANIRLQASKDLSFIDILFDEIKKFTIKEGKKKIDFETKREFYKMQSAFTDIDFEEYDIEKIKYFIEQDKQIIELINNILNKLTVDKKLDNLKTVLKGLKNKKVLIFSYFATTINYIKSEISKDDLFLKELNQNTQIEYLTSVMGTDYIHDAVERFSPVAQKMNIVNGKIHGKQQIDFLFSTDVLSEGQNLQDCGIIINYDLHWNPVKMVQRNGRINRIGSEHENIYIYNFRPDTQLDKFLQLMKRLQQKIQIIGATVGLETSVLGEIITPKEFGLIEKIYSDNIEIKKQAIEELERENDLAFDEQFENDLRDFIRTATDTEKDRVLNMNFNKWCGINNLAKNEKILTYNVGKTEFDFFRFENEKFELIENKLHALNKIRNYNFPTKEFDKQRQTEKINYSEKEKYYNTVQQYYKQINAYQQTIDIDLSSFAGVKKGGGASSLKKEKDLILELINENQNEFSTDNIKRLKDILLSQNLATEHIIRKMLKNNNFQINMSLIDDILFQGIYLPQSETDKDETTKKPEIWFGFYKK